MGQSAEELRREIERTRGSLSEDLEAIGDRVSPRRMVERRTNRIKDVFGTGRERVFGRVDQVRYGTTDKASTATDAVSGAVGSAMDTVRSAPHMATQGAATNPLIAGGVAFGLGFLAAVMFPGSEVEAQAAERLGEAARPLAQGVTESATEAAREVAATAKEAGQQAAQDLKESATEHAQQVKQTAAEEKQNIQS